MKSIDNRHEVIIVEIENENICYFELIEFNPEYPKTFCLLIKDIINELNKKGIKIIKQRMTRNKDIMEAFSRSKIYEINEEEVVIISEIRYFAIEVYRALGMVKEDFMEKNE